jgi:hypothetical protein
LLFSLIFNVTLTLQMRNGRSMFHAKLQQRQSQKVPSSAAVRMVSEQKGTKTIPWKKTLEFQDNIKISTELIRLAVIDHGTSWESESWRR